MCVMVKIAHRISPFFSFDRFYYSTISVIEQVFCFFSRMFFAIHPTTYRGWRNSCLVVLKMMEELKLCCSALE